MTKLVFLDDTYKFEHIANVEKIQQLEDGRIAILLNETIFYPQGGGQPCDTGIISSEKSVFKVNDVRMDKDGVVFHIGVFEKSEFLPGENVKLLVDKDRRIKNAKSHSAGHLIDCAVKNIGLLINTTKGYHFSDGPYVEYSGEILVSDEIIKKLQNAIDELVAKNIEVNVTNLSADQALRLRINVPAGKSARIIAFKGFEGCGCGGTHVKKTVEIGKIAIRKIKVKGGTTKICYELI